jgi:hypothetical protein
VQDKLMTWQEALDFVHLQSEEMEADRIKKRAEDAATATQQERESFFAGKDYDAALRELQEYFGVSDLGKVQRLEVQKLKAAKALLRGAQPGRLPAARIAAIGQALAELGVPVRECFLGYELNEDELDAETCALIRLTD